MDALDAIQSLLLVELFYLLLELPLPGTKIRPVRVFLEWGQSSPFLLFTLVALTLMVWRVIGRDYGLQEAFFHDATTEFALGTGGSLLILGVIFEILRSGPVEGKNGTLDGHARRTALGDQVSVGR